MKAGDLKKLKEGEISNGMGGGMTEQLKENSCYEGCVLACAFDAQQSAGRSFSGVQRSHAPSRPPQKGWRWFHPSLSRQVSPQNTNTSHKYC